MQKINTQKERLTRTYIFDDKLRATLAKHIAQYGCKVTVGNRLNIFDPYKLGGKHKDVFIDIYHDAIISLVEKIGGGTFKKQSEMGAVVNFLKTACWYNWSDHDDNPKKIEKKGGGTNPYEQGIDIAQLEYLQGTDDFSQSLEYRNLQKAIRRIVTTFPNKPPVWFATRLQMILAGDSNDEIAEELNENKDYTRKTKYDVIKKFKQIVAANEQLKQLIKEYLNLL